MNSVRTIDASFLNDGVMRLSKGGNIVLLVFSCNEYTNK